MRCFLPLIIAVFIFFTSCGDNALRPDPITDGISFVITTEGADTKTLQISRSGENFDAVFLHTDGTKGLGMSVSPSGCFINVFKLKKQIDFEYISTSIPALVYTALNHNFVDDDFKNGIYYCSDTCGDFEVSVGDDGVISKVNFVKYNYICNFDYKNA